MIKSLNILKRFKRYKHEDPIMRMKTINIIYPPPGENLKLPDWTPEEFLKRIGLGTSEFADKFENLENLFKTSTVI